MDSTNNEIQITNEIITKFNKIKCELTLHEVSKTLGNVENYAYDIEVKQKGLTVAIIEAKKRFTRSSPTTDSIIASYLKLQYENKYKKNLKIIFLIYIDDNTHKIDKSFRNKVFEKVDEMLNVNVALNIINLNINEPNYIVQLKNNLEKLF